LGEPGPSRHRRVVLDIYPTISRTITARPYRSRRSVHTFRGPCRHVAHQTPERDFPLHSDRQLMALPNRDPVRASSPNKPSDEDPSNHCDNYINTHHRPTSQTKTTTRTPSAGPPQRTRLITKV